MASHQKVPCMGFVIIHSYVVHKGHRIAKQWQHCYWYIGDSPLRSLREDLEGESMHQRVW